MKLAMAQMSMEEDIESNFIKTLQILHEAKSTDLLFFPEIQWNPFFPQFEKSQSPYAVQNFAIKKNHPYIKKICEKAKENHMFVSPNIYLKNKGQYFDASLWITPEGEVDGISEMVHVHQTKYFYEKDYYSPSADGFHTYDTPFGNVGIVICFDRHFPESIRTCALKGAKLIIIPTANMKSEPMEMFEWELRVQAMQNNVFIAMCNRVGKEDSICFAGESIIIDPNGNVLKKADENEQIVTAEIDLSQCMESRKARPYIKLRRPGFYM